MTSIDPGPLVSIIIPAYNYAKYLPEALESALRQTYPNTEVIVIDDGSTDDTPEVVNPYLSRMCYHRKQNGGLSAARNTGISLAKGDYFVFLDADDLLNPDMVETSLQAMCSWPNPLDVVANLSYVINKDGAVIYSDIPQPLSVDREISREDLIVSSRFPVHGLVRKNALQRIGGFDEALRSTEDRDVWIKIAGQGRILRLGRHLTAIRMHGENMSSRAQRQAATMRTILYRSIAQTRPWTKRTLLFFRAWSGYFLTSARLYRESKKPFKSLFNVALSLLLWPWFGTFDSATFGGYKKPMFRVAFMLVTCYRICRKA